ncbi:hypothetical protein BN1723_017535 [Verticillium longisporum]|uniref:Uncharacterized protein n=1 Tax=Verticillium longisporum TaxID=100787 RepID=A0A0G4L6U7_VERLO|nr:hypothetical protein BN1723_017535 [Verticillium longisporum]
MNRSGGGRLSLVKTTTRGSVISIVQADSPHAQKYHYHHCASPADHCRL